MRQREEETYQWDSPQDWLADTAREWGAARLFQELMNLARLLDADDLEAEFQGEMAADGYFSPEVEEEGDDLEEEPSE